MTATPPAALPRSLKILYTAWFLVWVPSYWILTGPANFLWLCDVANFVMLAALWAESALLVSSQAVSVLVIQGVWAFDLLGRLVLGSHPIGGTEYMFDPAEPALTKFLSLFHLFMPVLILWAVRRLGYDGRGWKLQSAISSVVLPLSLLADPARNLNWIWRPFGVEQTWMPVAAYVVFCMAAYPLFLYFPTHLALRRIYRRRRVR